MKIIWAENFWTRLRGLMFRKNRDIIIVFPMKKPERTRASIHSVFVFFTFDVVFLDENGTVVEKYTVKPFTLNLTPRNRVKYIIELPEGMGNMFSLGERLDIPNLTKELQKRYLLFKKAQTDDANRLENKGNQRTKNS